jgi:hypothetical protein
MATHAIKGRILGDKYQGPACQPSPGPHGGCPHDQEPGKSRGPPQISPKVGFKHYCMIFN